MLKDRVSALREANIYEPQRYRHLVSSIKIVRDAVERSDHLDVVANFIVLRTMQDKQQFSLRLKLLVQFDVGSFELKTKVAAKNVDRLA